MKTINAQFKLLDQSKIESIQETLKLTKLKRDKTLEQVKRIQQRAQRLLIRKRKRLELEQQLNRQAQERIWQAQIQSERSVMKDALIGEIQGKCQAIIKDILNELIVEVPEIALSRAKEKLLMLLKRLTGNQSLALECSTETSNYLIKSQLPDLKKASLTLTESLAPGDFRLSLTAGKISSSVKKDLDQLLTNGKIEIKLLEELKLLSSQAEVYEQR